MAKKASRPKRRRDGVTPLTSGRDRTGRGRRVFRHPRFSRDVVPEVGMMKTPLDMKKIARGLRAARRGKVSATAGYFGAMQLLADIDARFRVPARGGRATDPDWAERRLVPLAPRTLERLEVLTAASASATTSTSNRCSSPRPAGENRGAPQRGRGRGARRDAAPIAMTGSRPSGTLRLGRIH